MEESSWVYPTKPNFFTIPWSAYNGKIPFIITDLIKGIHEREGKSDFHGLFRENSLSTELDEFSERLSSELLREYPEEIDALFLSNLLKRYLKSVSEIEPLISKEMTEELFSIVRDKDIGDLDVAAIKEQIDKLDDSHKVPLSYICYIFKQIAENPETGMNVQSFSNILGAILLPSDASLYKQAAHLVNSLMMHVDELFDKSLYSEDKYQTPEEITNMAMPYIDFEDLAIEAQRRAIRDNCPIQMDYEYMDSLLGLKYPTS